MIDTHNLFNNAKDFIVTCYNELGMESKIKERLTHIKREIEEYGFYEHTFEELSHGAKMAWRNSNRCIGRLFWHSLEVIDARHLETEEEIRDALIHHIYLATNGGKIKPTITIFKPKISEAQQIRIWNHQLLRYAGYETAGGDMIGDPISKAFTQVCKNMGWEGTGTHFDLLPFIIQVNDNQPKIFPIPENLPLEVKIEHPVFDWFKDLNLKWYAVPIISDMELEIGGLHYTAAPFNGWYMETEIGARNFADPFRYNLLPKVASLMGLDTSRNATLWKDKALIELNLAILYSYKKAGVNIVDHHTAAEQFQHFEEQEKTHGRKLTGDWSWLIPPVSPATTPIFHQTYEDVTIKPNFDHQGCPYDHSS